MVVYIYTVYRKRCIGRMMPRQHHIHLNIKKKYSSCCSVAVVVVVVVALCIVYARTWWHSGDPSKRTKENRAKREREIRRGTNRPRRKGCELDAILYEPTAECCVLAEEWSSAPCELVYRPIYTCRIIYLQQAIYMLAAHNLNGTASTTTTSIYICILHWRSPPFGRLVECFTVRSRPPPYHPRRPRQQHLRRRANALPCRRRSGWCDVGATAVAEDLLKTTLFSSLWWTKYTN